jgi:hypothetical protein
VSTAYLSIGLPTKLLKGDYRRTDVTYEHGRAQVELVLIDEAGEPQRVRMDFSLAALEDFKWSIDCPSVACRHQRRPGAGL